MVPRLDTIPSSSDTFGPSPARRRGLPPFRAGCQAVSRVLGPAPGQGPGVSPSYSSPGTFSLVS